MQYNNNISFLDGGGETGALIRAINWAENPLGPPQGWPQSLRTTLGILLNSKFPMFLLWGPEFICFYNDAYRPSLGNNGKHPTAMGQRGAECWAEIWDFVKPIFDGIMAGGEAYWVEDQLLPIYRNGEIQDVYWTFSYSPVKDEEGKPTGIFVAVTETTGKVKTFKEVTQSRADLEFAVDAAELGTFDYNPVTNKFVGNARMKGWFGLPAEAEVDLDLAISSMAERDRGRVVNAIQHVLSTPGSKYDITYSIINPVTKIERMVRARGKVYFNAEGVAIKFNGNLQDITDENIARRQLAESERNFRSMIAQAPVAMCVLRGPDHIVEVANNYIYEIWGKTAEQTLYKPLFEGLREVKGQGLEEILRNVYITGEQFVASERPIYLPRQGRLELRYINFVYSPFMNGHDIEGVIVVATDVTEQVTARRSIEDAEERARLAMDAVEMGTYDLYFTTNELITSPRFDRIFGLDSTAPHSSYVAAVHPDDREIRRLAHEEALITGRLNYTARVIWPDKSLHWFHTGGKVYFDENNRPVRLLGTAIDITDVRNAAEELQETNQRLEIALEAGDLGSYEMNVETGRINCNDQFKEDFGLKDVAGIAFVDLINIVVPAHRDAVRSAVALAIRNRSAYSEEFQVEWPDGSLHWIRASGKVRFEHNKTPIIIGVTFDITGHKNLQQQKDDFISIASHELKTPVTSIKAYTQVLERIFVQQGATREAGMIAKMDAQVNRLTTLIGDLLDVTKINSGRLQFNDQYFVFDELVAEVIEDLQRTTEKHTLVNEFNYSGSVYADRDRIAQVITNLITNAIKYSPQPGDIIINSSLEDNEVHLCVKDYGVGISEEKQERVFEQFYRVSGNKQHTFPGLGLGLYISSEIIKREGGRIWVNSVEGAGATFCFALPLRIV